MRTAVAALSCVLAAACTAAATAPSTSDIPAAGGHAARWRPPVTVSWQWQLTGPVDLDVDAAVYDLDAMTTTAEQVATLHKAGRRVICYVNVGAVERWRDDAAAFPPEVIGGPNGWPGERWLDIRRVDVLEPIIAARLDVCRDKGFDAVEPDNVDGYANDTGFLLTAADQLGFNRRVAELAHRRGLAVALKNDAGQAAELEPAFDFAITEQCVEYDECDAYAAFRRAGKAILDAEYSLPPEWFCPIARRAGVNAIGKPRELTAERVTC